MIADELSHLIKQLVSQAMIDQRPFAYGHIASYDDKTHRVRCIIPSMQDHNGQPLLSPWMPMGTLSAGAGYGMQVVYAGGATAENPTGGEQVLIGLFDRQRGVAAVPAMFFSGASHPPSMNLPANAPAVAAGDVLLSNPSGSLIRLHPNGDMELYGSAKLIATIQGDATVTTQGNASVTAAGNAALTATGDATITAGGTARILAPVVQLGKAATDTLLGLCTSAFRDWVQTHVHSNGNAGTNTGLPTTSPPANGVTSIVKGE